MIASRQYLLLECRLGDGGDGIVYLGEYDYSNLMTLINFNEGLPVKTWSWWSILDN
jgi:hypothetical protein